MEDWDDELPDFAPLRPDRDSSGRRSEPESNVPGAGAALAARARVLLAHGPISADELARKLYNVSGPIAPWLPMLDRLLLDVEGVEREPNGMWRSAHPVAREPLVLSVRTASARSSRLLQLAAAPPATLRPVWRWAFWFDGGRSRGPIGHEDCGFDSAPVEFGQVAAEIRDLLDARRLVVTDARCREALNLELSLCSQPPLSGPYEVLGGRLWPVGSEKLSLERVRATFGLNPHAADEMLGELELLAAAFIATPTRASSDGQVAAGRSREALRQVVADLPSSPGVYQFRAVDGTTLYIGSAGELRRRVLSYFGEQIEMTRGLRGLIERTGSLHTETTGVHLEALLREAEQIASERPVYNVQRTVHTAAAWLRIGSEPPTPTVQVALSPREDGALYLGPAANRAALASLAAVLAELWSLRRRGASRKSDRVSEVQRDEIAALLKQPEEFVVEARRRFHAREGDLSVRGRSRLGVDLAAAEEFVLGARLEPSSSLDHSALIGRYDHESGDVSLLVVRELGCTACARAAAVRRPLVSAVKQLLAAEVEAAPTPAAWEAAITARWLYAHRADPWVFSVEDEPNEIAARLLSLVAEAEARRHSQDYAYEPDPWESW